MTKMLIGNGAGGSVAMKRIMAGTGTGAFEAWPGKRVYRDDFVLTNTYLEPTTWNVVGTSPWLLMQDGGNGFCFANTTDGNRASQAVWREDTSTWEQYVKAELGAVGGSGLGTWLQVHAAIDSSSYVGIQWNDSTLTLFNSPGGGAATINRGTASEARAVGKIVELRAEKNPTTGIFTYRALINGVQRISWPDASNIIPKPAGNKKVGWGSQAKRQFFQTNYGPSLAWWEGGDI
ncbi:hypothetical protein QNA23_11225 [Rhodococcus erythropolis]|uniref:hypothetical protein n=1 Tax=Rhodococcus erythropolis TaxID=1833 RepID=UPI0024BB0C14|nr:hypothetical protein [Rhodococcus erythropolis]MDJ0404054.1 hypothetical protein [Rhodococcus erythropolis]